MSEEEKKAIETFKKGYGLTKAETEIISNLIENQQKELTIEKDKNEKIKNKIRKLLDVYDAMLNDPLYRMMLKERIKQLLEE